MALLEYMIETQILARAAQDANLNSGSLFQSRLEYARRRLLRDIYFERLALGQIKESDVQSYYDEQVTALGVEDQVRVRHVLVDSEAAAIDVLRRVKAGADIKVLARELSKDPASNWQEGDLGFLALDKLNESFAKSIAGVKSGVSERLAQTEFGWHVVYVEERRKQQVPPLAEIRYGIQDLLAQRRLQKLMGELRKTADIKIFDSSIKQSPSALNSQVAESPPTKAPESLVSSEATKKSAARPPTNTHAKPKSQAEEWSGNFFKR